MSLKSRLQSAYRALTGADEARPINASYDAARVTNETLNLWANSDALDADSANSLAVRQKLRFRTRYERANSGQCSGIVGTQANYVIGKGPTLRMQTGSTPFNSMVEEKFKNWSKAVGFARKLRVMSKAKTGDGEAVAILIFNPAIKDPVKLGISLVECDRLTAPVMRADSENYVDGIHFDDFGNAIAYDILRRHPGSSWQGVRPEFDTYPENVICHWYTEQRPGQHRGTPDIGPSLNTFGTGRRFREAVVACAETAADFAVLVEVGAPNTGAEPVDSFTTFPIEKRTMTTLPAGSKAAQMKAEQPTSTYESFTRAMTSEAARPLHMPYNIAACDSSDYSYSGGQLDHLTFFVSLDVEQQDCAELVSDKVFAMWFDIAVSVYGWDVLPTPAPKHSFAWAGKPKSDPVKTAESRQINLATGSTSPSEVANEDGDDYEDRIDRLAKDYGISIDEMKQKLLDSNFQQVGGAPGAQPKPNNGPVNRIASLVGNNGNGS